MSAANVIHYTAAANVIRSAAAANVIHNTSTANVIRSAAASGNARCSRDRSARPHAAACCTTSGKLN